MTSNFVRAYVRLAVSADNGGDRLVSASFSLPLLRHFHRTVAFHRSRGLRVMGTRAGANTSSTVFNYLPVSSIGRQVWTHHKK